MSDELMLERQLQAQIAEQAAELKRLRDAISRQEHGMQQTLGKALGYPPLYPGASDVDDGSVCVGDNVAASLAVDAARKIVEQAAELERLRTLAALAEAANLK